MTITEAKSLKWGDTIYPSQKHRDNFRQGKTVEAGIYLGLTSSKWFGRNHTVMRVIHKDTSTVYKYDPAYWETNPLTPDAREDFKND